MRSPMADEGVLRKLLEHMNSQLPSKRVRLSELLAMAEPHYVGRDGTEYAISKEELSLLREAVDELGVGDVRLPLVIMGDPSHEQSVWRIEGETECSLVLHLLGKDNPERKERVFLYAPHITALRRKLPTTTVCMFLP